jgi:hypothetical protein
MIGIEGEIFNEENNIRFKNIIISKLIGIFENMIQYDSI